jgi:hypothetical protein
MYHKVLKIIQATLLSTKGCGSLWQTHPYITGSDPSYLSLCRIMNIEVNIDKLLKYYGG